MRFRRDPLIQNWALALRPQFDALIPTLACDRTATVHRQEWAFSSRLESGSYVPLRRRLMCPAVQLMR
jgi:hypothetical protein